MKLVGSNETGWAELWDPITKEVPQFPLEKLPELLKSVDKVDFGQLKLELTRLSKRESNWGDTMVTMVTWPTIVGIMLIVGIASLSWWWWKKRQLKMSGVKVNLAENANASGVECSIGAPYQDAVETAAGVEEQLPATVRDVRPENGPIRPAVKARQSKKKKKN